MAMRDKFLDRIGHKQTTVSLFASVLLLLVSIFGVSLLPNKHAAANNQKYVTVHYDGTSQTVATDAQTVGEVLERANIPVGERDAVEPAKATPLVSNDYNVNVYRARPVTVVDNGQRFTTTTAARGAQQMAEAAGVKVYPEDKLDVSRIDDFLREGTYGLKVTIDRATPINFELYGTPTAIRTQAVTVADLLKEKQITLKDGDTLSAAQDAAITAGMTIKLIRNGVQTVTIEEDIAFPVKTIQDADQPLGYREVQTEGKKGRRTVTYEVKIENDQEVSRNELNSVTTVQAVEQVVIVGAKFDMAEAFAKLRQCEAGGNYQRNSGNGYYGAYQYDISTWANYQGYERPDLAPPDVQDAKALETYSRRGWSPWPACSSKLGLR